MLEGPAFLVSRDLPNACEEELQWAYNASQVIENSKRKRPLEEKEETGLKRLSELQEAMEEETQPVLLSLFPQVDQPDSRHPNGDNDDTSSFIPNIGRDLSLNGLLNCPRVHCDSIASHRPVTQCQSGDNDNPNLWALDLSLNSLVPLSRPDHCSMDSIQLGTQDHSGNNSGCSSSLIHDHGPMDSIQSGTQDHSGDNSGDSSSLIHDHGSMDSIQSGNQDHSGDSSSLIHGIGRDLSINCLLHCPRSNYCSIASLNRGFRSLIRSGEIYRLRRQMSIAEHWVYLCCNLVEWEAFDPVSCKWMALPVMKSNQCFMFADKESLAVGTELLVFGKQIDSLVIYKYSLLTNSWSSGTKTNTPRCLFGSASLGEIAIVAGGCDLRGNVLSSAELYNSETGTWEIIPSMNRPRKLCAAVFMDGKFFIIGGIGGPNPNASEAGIFPQNELTPITTAEVYDPRTKSWQEIPDMYPSLGDADDDTPASSKAPPLLAVVKNELYAALYAEKELLKYDKERNRWNPIGKLPEQATSMLGWGVAFRACGDLLVVIGGPKTFGGGFIEISAWEPNDEGPPEWTLLGRKHSGSFVYNCAVMGC